MADGKVIKILEVSCWETINYPDRKTGTAEIAHIQYPAGYYLMEGVAGYWLWQNNNPISITELRINHATVMVDDPLHWIGMKLFAESATGRVMVGGLGLGLVIHHLVNNDAVTRIDIIEVNKDVIALTGSLLPRDERIHIIQGDLLESLWQDNFYDTIINDIWVNSGNRALRLAGFNSRWETQKMLATIKQLEETSPASRVFYWGVRRRQNNPAITTSLPEEYWNLANGYAPLAD